MRARCHVRGQWIETEVDEPLPRTMGFPVWTGRWVYGAYGWYLAFDRIEVGFSVIEDGVAIYA